jgi:hypothetical protein
VSVCLDVEVLDEDGNPASENHDVLEKYERGIDAIIATSNVATKRSNLKIRPSASNLVVTILEIVRKCSETRVRACFLFHSVMRSF